MFQKRRYRTEHRVEIPEGKYDRQKILQKIALTAYPVFLELVIGSLFGMVDMMMLGNIADPGISAASISSVGITNQMINLGLALVQALCVGGTTMVSRYLGAGRREELQNVVKHVVLMAVFGVGIPVFCLSQLMTVPMMKLIGATPEVLAVGQNYFRIIMAGYLLQTMNFALFSALRGVQNTRMPMAINITANFLNVIGNYLLIYGKFGFPELGVTGAAISTFGSQVLASCLLLTYVLRREKTIHLKLTGHFRFSPSIMKNLVYIGIPSSMEQMALRGGIFAYVRIVTNLGTVAYATHQVCLNILSFGFTSGQALGIASSSLVGHALGQKDKALAKYYVRETRRLGYFISTIFGMGYFFFGPQIMELYTSNPDIFLKGKGIMKIIAFVQPFQTVQLLTAGAIRGAGDTFYPFLSTCVGILVVRLGVAYTAVRMGYGLYGAWAGLICDQLTRSFLIDRRFRSDHWLHVNLR